ncbi:phage tail protein [Paractinoplanes durhamensis]|uniref:phage tail protein n=1 Tax=Paractinoplanes durhamensis TaxID=113563 RepID=UPI003643D719
MARFTVNANRFDPYLGFKFKVKWDGHYIAALNKCSALKRTTEVTPWYEGATRAGRTSFPARASTTRSPSKPASPTTPRSRSGPTR